MLTLEYQCGIADAGGQPIVASPFADADELMEISDAWLITGGDDFPGELFNQPTHPSARLAHPLRYPFEKCLLSAFAETSKPILGICYGSQFLCIASGGSIHQHLPDLLGNQHHTNGASRISATGKFASIVGSEPFDVACFHHQAIDDPGSGWDVCASAEDGTVEAIEHRDRWAIGVQWHPERTPESRQTKQLFNAFVEEAKLRR
jgi:putative glutamine amidotransferase